MSNLLQYFERELDYFSRSFSEFERLHSQAAKVLGVTGGKSDDPHVARLIDSVALTAARMQKRLDENVPEIALDLLRLICPVLTIGAPSYCVLELAKDDDQLAEPTLVPIGTRMSMANLDDELCVFQVAHDTWINPVAIDYASLKQAPFNFTSTDNCKTSTYALCIGLSGFDSDAEWQDCMGEVLDLYISGSGQKQQRMISLLTSSVCGISLVSINNDFEIVMDVDVLRCGHKDTYLPEFPPQMRAIGEMYDFLCYPDKAGYFGLCGIKQYLTKMPAGPIELRLMLSNAVVVPDMDLGPVDISLNCIALINWFEEHSAPTNYAYARDSVPVFAREQSNNSATENRILHLKEVVQLTSEGERVLQSVSSAHSINEEGQAQWQQRHVVGNFSPSRVEISFSVPTNTAVIPPDIAFVAKLICSNGTKVMGIYAQQPVQCGLDALANVVFLVKRAPTASVLPNYSASRIWDLLALLNGNFHALLEQHQSHQALSDLIRLCSPTDNNTVVDALVSVKISQSVASVRVGQQMMLSAGSVIELVLDSAAMPYSAQSFALALNRFFAAFVSYDRFYQLIILQPGHLEPLVEFPRTHGSQVNL